MSLTEGGGMGVGGEGLDESREGNNPWILHRREMGFQGEKGNAYRLFPWQPTEEADRSIYRISSMINNHGCHGSAAWILGGPVVKEVF